MASLITPRALSLMGIVIERGATVSAGAAVFPKHPIQRVKSGRGLRKPHACDDNAYIAHEIIKNN